MIGKGDNKVKRMDSIKRVFSVTLGIFSLVILLCALSTPLSYADGVSDFTMTISEDADSNVTATYTTSDKTLRISGHGQISYAKWCEMAGKFSDQNFNTYSLTSNSGWDENGWEYDNSWGRQFLDRIVFENDNVPIKLCNAGSKGAVFQRFGGEITFNKNSEMQVDTSDVTDMRYMFYGAEKFNDPIGSWDVSNVTNMSYMFGEAVAFNQDISAWTVSSVADMSHMFDGASVFNQDIGRWTVENVTDMSAMFQAAMAFNQDIGGWTVSSVRNMNYMFNGARVFNQDISGWTVLSVTSMKNMFASTNAFNQDLNNWNVENVTNMGAMFNSAKAFNGKIGNWNVGNVTNMGAMFSGARSFNQDIGGWTVSNVTNMNSMFYSASAFNQNIGSWNVENVTNMEAMFLNTKAFNQDISKWDTSRVSKVGAMFKDNQQQKKIVFINRGDKTNTSVTHWGNNLFDNTNADLYWFRGLEGFTWTRDQRYDTDSNYQIINVTKKKNIKGAFNTDFVFEANDEFIVIKRDDAGTLIKVVKFLAEDESLLKMEVVDRGGSATPPDASVVPEKIGYTFSDWDKTLTNVIEDMVVKPVYTPNKVTVTFKDFDGTVLKTEEVDYNSSATAPEEPNREGFRFTGWDNTFTNVTEDVIVTAEYAVKEYTVTFRGYDDSVLKTETLKHGQSATAPDVPSRDGYLFSGWSEDFSAVESDLDITALYRRDPHVEHAVKRVTVVFKDYDGKVLRRHNIDENSDAIPPEVKEREGYQFIGWDKSYENVKTNLIVTARYEKIGVENEKTPHLSPVMSEKEAEKIVAGFEDMTAHWSKADVVKVVQLGLFKGMSTKSFAPDDDTTRAMIYTLIHRISGEEMKEHKSGLWYADAMKWAVERGISDGSSPARNVTREELITMLYRYMGEPAIEGDMLAFTDVDKVSAYASRAVMWAVKEEILQGSPDGRIMPKSPAERGEVAALLARLTER